MYSPNKLMVPSGLARPSAQGYVPKKTHPLLVNNRLLAVAHGSGIMYDYYRYARGILSGTATTPAIVKRIGQTITISNSATAGGDIAFTSKPAVSADKITFAWVGMYVQTDAAHSTISCSGRLQNTSYRIGSVVGSPLVMLLMKGGVANAAAGVTLVANIPYAIAVSYDQVTDVVLYAARRLDTGQLTLVQSTATATPASASNTTWAIGKGNSLNAAEQTALALISFSFLPYRALIDWTADPWGLFEPRDVPVFDDSVFGVLTATLGTLTLVSAGVVNIIGTLAKTLGTLTLSSAGSVSVSGALAVTLGALTSVSAGSVAIVGALTATLGTLGIAAAGAVAVVGALSATLGVVTLASGGTVAGSARAGFRRMVNYIGITIP